MSFLIQMINEYFENWIEENPKNHGFLVLTRLNINKQSNEYYLNKFINSIVRISNIANPWFVIQIANECSPIWIVEIP